MRFRTYEAARKAGPNKAPDYSKVYILWRLSNRMVPIMITSPDMKSAWMKSPESLADCHGQLFLPYIPSFKDPNSRGGTPFQGVILRYIENKKGYIQVTDLAGELERTGLPEDIAFLLNQSLSKIFPDYKNFSFLHGDVMYPIIHPISERKLLYGTDGVQMSLDGGEFQEVSGGFLDEHWREKGIAAPLWKEFSDGHSLWEMSGK